MNYCVLCQCVGCSILHISCSVQIVLVKLYFEHGFYILKGNNTMPWQEKNYVSPAHNAKDINKKINPHLKLCLTKQIMHMNSA